MLVKNMGGPFAGAWFFRLKFTISNSWYVHLRSRSFVPMHTICSCLRPRNQNLGCYNMKDVKHIDTAAVRHRQALPVTLLTGPTWKTIDPSEMC